jgi:hypothetical protein
MKNIFFFLVDNGEYFPRVKIGKQLVQNELRLSSNN